MRVEDISIVALWGLILIVIGVIAYQALGPLIQAVGDILAAIVSGGFVIMAGILTHAFTEIREQRFAQVERMQRNYEKILDRIDAAVRSTNDDFSKAVLESWVVGSPKVIEHTQSLITCKKDDERRQLLEKIVVAMRADLGLPATDLTLPKGLFPASGGA